MLKVARPLNLIYLFFCENIANYIFQIQRNIEVATYCLVNPQQTLVTCLVKITLPNKKTGTVNKKKCSTNSFKKHTLQNATSYEQLAQEWGPML